LKGTFPLSLIKILPCGSIVISCGSICNELNSLDTFLMNELNEIERNTDFMFVYETGKCAILKAEGIYIIANFTKVL
jgi:hypothetical protein